VFQPSTKPSKNILVGSFPELRDRRQNLIDKGCVIWFGYQVPRKNSEEIKKNSEEIKKAVKKLNNFFSVLKNDEKK
jgi:hypothetical protein